MAKLPIVLLKHVKGRFEDMLCPGCVNTVFGFSCSRASRWTLRKIAKAGGAPETLVKSYSLKPVVVDEAHLYFFAEEGIFNDLLSTF